MGAVVAEPEVKVMKIEASPTECPRCGSRSLDWHDFDYGAFFISVLKCLDCGCIADAVFTCRACGTVAKLYDIVVHGHQCHAVTLDDFKRAVNEVYKAIAEINREARKRLREAQAVEIEL